MVMLVFFVTGSNQNSPEYAQIALQRVPSIAQSEDSNGEDWCQNQTVSMISKQFSSLFLKVIIAS